MLFRSGCGLSSSDATDRGGDEPRRYSDAGERAREKGRRSGLAICAGDTHCDESFGRIPLPPGGGLGECLTGIAHEQKGHSQSVDATSGDHRDSSAGDRLSRECPAVVHRSWDRDEEAAWSYQARIVGGRGGYNARAVEFVT